MRKLVREQMGKRLLKLVDELATSYGQGAYVQFFSFFSFFLFRYYFNFCFIRLFAIFLGGNKFLFLFIFDRLIV